jgi:hypothetical protein
MNKLLLTFASFGLAAGSFAQQNPTAMKYAPIISADLAKKHLSIIASDAYEGRETGKPGADKAAHYIADEFKLLGLQPIVNGSYFLDVPLVENAFKVSAFTVSGKSFKSGIDFYPSGSAAAKTISAAEIIFIGYGIESDNYNDLKGIDIKGKIVLYINDGEPMNNGLSRITGTDKKSEWSTIRSKRLKFLRSKNPALILAVGPNVADILKRFGGQFGGGQLSIKKDGPVENPTIAYNITPEIADLVLKGSGKTYAGLKSAIDAAGTPQTQTIKTDISTAYANQSKDVKAVDVLGYLPGSDKKLKDEVLVISAHYDHIGMLPEGAKDRVNNGADDDGSGTTSIMEIARAFSKAKEDGHGPRRSILFLGNVGEEKGLLGSEYYTDHPVIPLANTIADLNIDMVGRVGFDYIGKPDSANYVFVIGSSMLSTDLHKAGEKANDTYTKLKLDYKYDDLNDPNHFYERSDHYNFAKHGVPIVFYFNGVHADYHQPGDEVSKINFPLLAKRAQLVFYTAWDLVNADNRPVVDGKK